MKTRLAFLTAAVVASLAVLAVPGSSAAAADDQCATVGPSAAPDPWAQQMLAQQTAWPFAQGNGQTIAVLDSGVDAGQPQLHGRVAAGFDAITGSGPADTDCAGTGTQVAGAVAAAKTSATGIYGVAPGATIVPVRVTDEPGDDQTGTPTAAILARAFGWAVDHHVDIIDVSVVLTTDDPAVRDAVAAAVGDGITVVAAAGDRGTPDGGNPTTYPAAYPGVIGVAAIDAAGLPWSNSEHGSYVDITAPGVGVPALQREHGLVRVDGSTALAAGFVSGTAALVRQRWRSLHGSQITARLLGTASPSGGGSTSPYYGHGIVNPYLAVTDDVATAAPIPATGLTPVPVDRAALAHAAAQRHSRTLAIDFSVAALGVLIVIVLLAVGVPRARRRSWRPTYAAPLRERPEPDEPAPLPPLFDEVVH